MGWPTLFSSWALRSGAPQPRPLPSLLLRSALLRAADGWAAHRQAVLVVPGGDRELRVFGITWTVIDHRHPLRPIARHELDVLGRNRQGSVDRRGVRPNAFRPAVIEDVKVAA